MIREDVKPLSPICLYAKHCGARIVYGESTPSEGSVETPFRCLRCGATGIKSSRVDAQETA